MTLLSIIIMILAVIAEKMQIGNSERKMNEADVINKKKELLRRMCWDRYIIDGKWFQYESAVEHLNNLVCSGVTINSQKFTLEEAREFIKSDYNQKLNDLDSLRK